MTPITRGLTALCLMALCLMALAAQPALAGNVKSQRGGDAGSARYDRYLEEEAKKEREKAERLKQLGGEIHWNGQRAGSGFTDVPDPAIRWRVPPAPRSYELYPDQHVKGQ